MANNNIVSSVAPWLSVRNSKKAVEFYSKAFGAIEIYHIEDPDGNAVIKLSVNGCEFWLSDSPSDEKDKELVGGGTIRMILTVPGPDEFFARALQAGATEVYPVAEQNGWRMGRLSDPFGLHWEIGKELTA